MCPKLSLQSVSKVPAESQVRHYDELSENAKEQFPLFTDSSRNSVNTPVADELQECDLVKYTNYYRVDIK